MTSMGTAAWQAASGAWHERSPWEGHNRQAADPWQLLGILTKAVLVGSALIPYAALVRTPLGMNSLIVTLLVIVSMPGEQPKSVETQFSGAAGIQGCARRAIDILSTVDTQVPEGGTTEVRCKVERKPLPTN